MNTKIFTLIKKNLDTAFALPKYASIRESIGSETIVEDLPWTPARYRKFKDAVEAELGLPCEYRGTLKQIIDDLSHRYTRRFFAEIWKPRTGEYDYSGWALAETIAKQDPRNVLDVGCGYHPFRGRIPNLTGIDPYNNCADYEVDILDYQGPAGHTRSHHRSWAQSTSTAKDEIEQRFAHCVTLLAPGGKFYLRANPGIPAQSRSIRRHISLDF
jgi:hypothetical protein